MAERPIADLVAELHLDTSAIARELKTAVVAAGATVNKINITFNFSAAELTRIRAVVRKTLAKIPVTLDLPARELIRVRTEIKQFLSAKIPIEFDVQDKQLKAKVKKALTGTDDKIDIQYRIQNSELLKQFDAAIRRLGDQATFELKKNSKGIVEEIGIIAQVANSIEPIELFDEVDESNIVAITAEIKKLGNLTSNQKFDLDFNIKHNQVLAEAKALIKRIGHEANVKLDYDDTGVISKVVATSKKAEDLGKIILDVDVDKSDLTRASSAIADFRKVVKQAKEEVDSSIRMDDVFKSQQSQLRASINKAIKVMGNDVVKLDVQADTAKMIQHVKFAAAEASKYDIDIDIDIDKNNIGHFIKVFDGIATGAKAGSEAVNKAGDVLSLFHGRIGRVVKGMGGLSKAGAAILPIVGWLVSALVGTVAALVSLAASLGMAIIAAGAAVGVFAALAVAVGGTMVLAFKDVVSVITDYGTAQKQLNKQMAEGKAGAVDLTQAQQNYKHGLEGLSGAGQNFAHFIIEKLMPALDMLSDIAQSSVLNGFQQGINYMLDLLPEFASLLTHVGTTIGSIVSEIGRLLTLGKHTGEGAIAQLFEGIGQALDAIAPAIPPLVIALAQILAAATPILVGLMTLLGNAGLAFSKWIADITTGSRSGQLVDFFQSASEELAIWIGIISNLGGAIINILKPIVPIGHAIASAMLFALEAFNAFAGSTAGQIVIFVGTAVAVAALAGALFLLAGILAPLAVLVIALMLPFALLGVLVVAIAYGIYKLIQAFAEMIAITGGPGGTALDFIVNKLSGSLGRMGNAAGSARKQFSAAFDDLRNSFYVDPASGLATMMQSTWNAYIKTVNDVTVAEKNKTKIIEDAAEKEKSARKTLSDARRAHADAEIQAAESVASAERALSDAHQAVADARRDQLDDQKSSAKAVADAQRNLADAHRTVMDAQRAETDARKEALETLKDLREQVSDLANTKEGKEISLARAQENLTDLTKKSGTDPFVAQNATKDLVRARQKLAEVRSKGLNPRSALTAAELGVERAEHKVQELGGGKGVSALDMREAILAVKVAQDALSDSVQDGITLRAKHNEAERLGVNNSKGVIDARRSVSDAIRGEGDARASLGKAESDAIRSASDARRAISEAIRGEGDARTALAKAHSDGERAVADATLAVNNAVAALNKTIRDAAVDREAANESTRIAAERAAAAAIAFRNAGIEAGFSEDQVDNLKAAFDKLPQNVQIRIATDSLQSIQGLASVQAQMIAMAYLAKNPNVSPADAANYGRSETSAAVGRMGIQGGAKAVRDYFGHKLASGGPVHGEGTGTSDDIPAWLSKDEHVITNKEVRGAGGHEVVAATRKMWARGYAKGGPVTNMPFKLSANNIVAKLIANSLIQNAIKPPDLGVGGEGGMGGGNAAAGIWTTHGTWPLRKLGVASPNTMAAWNFVKNKWHTPSGGIVGGGSVSGSDHPWGKAFDAMTNVNNKAGKARGDAIVKYFGDNPDAFGTKYLIWNRRFSQGKGWGPYSGPSAHTDHVHVSLMSGAGTGGSKALSKHSGGKGGGLAQVAFNTAKSMGASNKILLALFEAGFVESGMRNLNYGDRDSVGYLQQRPSQGWPNPMHIPTATRSFVSRAIRKNRPNQSAGQLAQAVQVSAFPAKYDQAYGRAVSLLRSLGAAGFADGGYLTDGINLKTARKPEAVLNPVETEAFLDLAKAASRGEAGGAQLHIYGDIRNDVDVDHIMAKLEYTSRRL